jgi:hypothetical protein
MSELSPQPLPRTYKSRQLEEEIDQEFQKKKIIQHWRPVLLLSTIVFSVIAIILLLVV